MENGLAEIYRAAIDMIGEDCLVNPDTVVTIVDSGVEHSDYGIIHIVICNNHNFVVDQQTATKIAKGLEAKYASS